MVLGLIGLMIRCGLSPLLPSTLLGLGPGSGSCCGWAGGRRDWSYFGTCS